MRIATLILGASVAVLYASVLAEALGNLGELDTPERVAQIARASLFGGLSVLFTLIGAALAPGFPLAAALTFTLGALTAFPIAPLYPTAVFWGVLLLVLAGTAFMEWRKARSTGPLQTASTPPS
ncbi:hypothetical protein [Marinithermus hydrothermalis]|uniref:Integral membrane protein n=1 Tax=Marinithermus hydrothermalis (strain DSM 14884 / JCM 11576 / T1) TaxID=869210 RepID=F2NPX1_MARHT|nr:hypothetical protein [Marinithermus hydrothermalis]AEB11072.1 hypothetical protein Marky_0317 [Marinithermus hydrothermalis DSM 14884]